jgi:glycosyltransferase involved in cell wall biosynthesis
MKTDQFLVSVIIPVYNGEAFLAEAVESIQQQDHRPLEIIIVDDGSTDGTKKIAASFEDNIRYTYQHHSGPVVARNQGLRMAHGDVIGFLDADDLWLRNSLRLRLVRLVCDPSVEIVIGHTQIIRQRGVSDGKPRFEKYRRPWPALSLGSAIIRKPVFDKVGLFDHTLPFGEDVDWFLRAQEFGISMKIIQEVTQYYRRHTNNVTNQTRLSQKYFAMALKKSLDRRRQQGDGIAIPLQRWFEPNK